MGNSGMWHQLKQAVEQARKKAARLCWADLHVHSPEAARDYCAVPAGLKSEDHAGCARWLLEEVSSAKPHLRVLGITDHFKCRTACEAARLGSEFGVLVLPGLEIAVKCTEFHDDTIHLLLLFPPSSAPETVYAIVSELGGPPYEEAGAGSYISRPVGDVLDAALRRGALCIGAHVNAAPKGIRHFVRRSSLDLMPAKRHERELRNKPKRSAEEDAALSELAGKLSRVEDQIQERYLTFLGTSTLGAVQVRDEREVVHYASEHCEPLGVRSIACILASDAHAPGEVGAPGKATLLRMADPSLRAVQAALSDPETRVRFSQPSQDRIVIRGIRFAPVNGTSGGFFADTAIAFSENLTCVIGPRGSGKSAIIEAVRFALGHPLHRDETLREDAEHRRDLVLRNTTVQLWISPRDQDDLVVQRDLHSASQPYDLEGIPLRIDPANSVATQVATYGWSEIEQLGKDWAAQRVLIDGASSDLRDLHAAVTDARTELQRNRSEAVTAARQIQQQNSQLADLPDVERQFRVLDTPGLREAFKGAERASRVKDLVAQAEEKIREALDAFLDSDSGQPVDVGAALQAHAGKLLSDAEAESLSLPAPLTSPEFREALNGLAAALGTARSSLATFVQLLSQAGETAAEDEREAHEAAGRKLLDAFREDIEAGRETEETVRRQGERRSELKQRYDELLDIRRKRDEQRVRLNGLLETRARDLILAFEEALTRVSTWRRDKAREITDRLAQFAARAPVTVAVGALEDRTELSLCLYNAEDDSGLLKKSAIWSFVERKIASTFARAFLPWELVRAIQAKALQQIEDVFRKDGKGDAGQDAHRLLEHLQPRADGSDDYEPDRLDRLLKIDETLVSDKPVIMLEGAPIETLSPGQRCTALMPIILTEGDCPLLIDQPEDNLDNTMVFRVLVDVLRQLKDRRQVIVATHNPNIPVCGDAEQMVVLHHKTLREGEVMGQGAIDLPEIVAHVVEIMEGGPQAFETRARKYGYDIRDSKQPA